MGYSLFRVRSHPIAQTTAGNLAAASYTISTTTGPLTDTYVGSFSANWSMVGLLLRPATTTNGTVISYIHTDHLGSTALVTNASGTPVQTLDYYPYGGTRVSSGSQLENRQYIGQFADSSGLNYLNARYYDPARGQFSSEDPVFWEIGLTQDGKTALTNPQALNSFAYGNGNPIVKADPLGRGPFEAAVGYVVGAALGYAGKAYEDYLTGTPYDANAYMAAAAGGASAGAVAGMTDGISFLISGPLAGTVGGTVKSLAQQSLQNPDANINLDLVNKEARSGAVFGLIPGFDLMPSFNTKAAIMPVVRTLYTKLNKAIIKSVSPSSLSKMIGASALQQAPAAAAQSSYDAGSAGSFKIPLSNNYFPTPQRCVAPFAYDRFHLFLPRSR